MSARQSPIVFTAQGINELWDLMESLAQARFASGEEPFAQGLKFDGVSRGADLVPLESVRWQVTEDRRERLLARGASWTALVTRWRNGSAAVAVTAADAEGLAKCVADVRARAPVREPRRERVDVEFWYSATTCPEQSRARSTSRIGPTSPPTTRSRFATSSTS